MERGSNNKDHSNSWYLWNGAATTKTTATAGTYGTGQQQQRPQARPGNMEARPVAVKSRPGAINAFS
jgi:hypothetical protein